MHFSISLEVAPGNWRIAASEVKMPVKIMKVKNIILVNINDWLPKIKFSHNFCTFCMNFSLKVGVDSLKVD